MSQETSIEKEMAALTAESLKEEVKSFKINTTEEIVLGNVDAVFSGSAKDGSEVVIISTRSQMKIDGNLVEVSVKGLGPTLEAAKKDHQMTLEYALTNKQKTIDVYVNGSTKYSFTSFGIFTPRTAEPALIDRRATAPANAAPASL